MFHADQVAAFGWTLRVVKKTIDSVADPKFLQCGGDLVIFFSSSFLFALSRIGFPFQARVQGFLRGNFFLNLRSPWVNSGASLR